MTVRIDAFRRARDQPDPVTGVAQPAVQPGQVVVRASIQVAGHLSTHHDRAGLYRWLGATPGKESGSSDPGNDHGVGPDQKRTRHRSIRPRSKTGHAVCAVEPPGGLPDHPDAKGVRGAAQPGVPGALVGDE